MRRIILIFLSLIFLLQLVGCGHADMVEVDIAYVNNPESKLGSEAIVFETRELFGRYKSELYEAAVNALFQPPENNALLCIFPDDIAVNEVRQIDEETIRVQLNSAYRKLSGINKTMADYCIALTLCNLEGISFVEISSEDDPEHIVVLSAEGAVMSPAELEIDAYNVTLYFADESTMDLISVEHSVLLSDPEELPRAVVESLITGVETHDGQKYVLGDSEVRLNDIYTVDNTCYVDLNLSFLKIPVFTETGDSLTLYSLVNSLCALEDIQYVQILINGYVRESYFSAHFQEPFAEYWDF